MKIKTLLILFLTFCVYTNVDAQKPIKDSVAYAFGTQFGLSIQESGLLEEIDIESFIDAVRDAAANKSRLTEDDSNNVLQNYMSMRREKEYKETVEEGKAFMEQNAKVAGVVTLPSGLQYKILKQGTGIKPKVSDEVEVHYTGALLNGELFDSSYERGSTISFPLNGVIPGWTEGMQYIAEGGKIALYVPYYLGYGEMGVPGSPIEPYATLIFEVELIKVNISE